jgi:hypothetical protein
MGMARALIVAVLLRRWMNTAAAGTSFRWFGRSVEITLCWVMPLSSQPGTIADQQRKE